MYCAVRTELHSILTGTNINFKLCPQTGFTPLDVTAFNASSFDTAKSAPHLYTPPDITCHGWYANEIGAK